MAAPVADQRVLRGVAVTLTYQIVGGDGEPAAPAGAVTVGIVNAAGSVVVAPGAATTGTGGLQSYVLPAASNTKLDLLTVTWTDVSSAATFTSLVDVVGGFYFTVAEARAADPALSNDVKFPTSVLVDVRRQIEEEFEQCCAVAFVPRYRRQRVRPDYDENVVTVDWPRVRSVRSVTSYDSAGNAIPWSPTDLLQLIAIDEGVRLTSRAWKWFVGGDTIVEYEHGLDRPPSEVKRAAIQRLRYLASQTMSGIPDRATSFSVQEGGTYRLDTADAFSTGQPDVDAVLGRWSLRVPGSA